MADAKPLHPHSRKAKQVARVQNRTEKLYDRKKDREHLRGVEGMIFHRSETHDPAGRVAWFQENLPSDVKCLTHQQIHELIEQYIARNDEEIAGFEEHTKQYPKRQRPLREDLVRKVKLADLAEYAEPGLRTFNLVEN